MIQLTSSSRSEAVDTPTTPAPPPRGCTSLGKKDSNLLVNKKGGGPTGPETQTGGDRTWPCPGSSRGAARRAANLGRPNLGRAAGGRPVPSHNNLLSCQRGGDGTPAATWSVGTCSVVWSPRGVTVSSVPVIGPRVALAGFGAVRVWRRVLCRVSCLSCWSSQRVSAVCCGPLHGSSVTPLRSGCHGHALPTGSPFARIAPKQRRVA